ncbi:DNA repair protein RadA [bacterium]|nr:DNA repair protein RadA [bacterium]MBU1754296.1 DNA repair protein RadA [bacterium]
MSKTFTKYYCQECGYESLKWLGKCPGCEKWNTIIEELVQPSSTSNRGIASFSSMPQEPRLLSEIKLSTIERLKSNIDEFDRVLGGGIVPGMLILIGGDPGIGKSTLLLQVSSFLSSNDRGISPCNKVLYVTGEESAQQIKLRADRLNIKTDNLYILSECNMSCILTQIENLMPQMVVIDSIQTVYTPEVSSSPGSVSQIRECTTALMYLAKGKSIPVFVVGHVTKEGSIAGPKVLEHIVDTVLYFEGDEQYTYRILRTIKNRFGSTNEIGVFEMLETGLAEVNSPSAAFLSQKPQGVSGSVVAAAIEGTRPILVEIQALVSPTNFGLPRRESFGIDYNRMSILLAILEKKAGLHLGQYDVFVNVAGGMKVNEPAVDLSVACSVASSLLDRVVPSSIIVFGEVGLSGEIRSVGFVEKRIEEALKLGFKQCILPVFNKEKIKKKTAINLIGVSTLTEALEAAQIWRG